MAYVHVYLFGVLALSRCLRLAGDSSRFLSLSCGRLNSGFVTVVRGMLCNIPRRSAPRK